MTNSIRKNRRAANGNVDRAGVHPRTESDSAEHTSSAQTCEDGARTAASENKPASLLELAARSVGLDAIDSLIGLLMDIRERMQSEEGEQPDEWEDECVTLH